MIHNLYEPTIFTSGPFHHSSAHVSRPDSQLLKLDDHCPPPYYVYE